MNPESLVGFAQASALLPMIATCVGVFVGLVVGMIPGMTIWAESVFVPSGMEMSSEAPTLLIFPSLTRTTPSETGSPAMV